MILASSILAALFIVAIWVAGYFLPWPLWLELTLTVAVLSAVALLFVLRRVVAVLRARRLERELLAQAEAQVAAARPDRRGEILELRAQLRRGIASLTSSGLGGGGASALYTLPWYVIVGPPGAGKTTALKQSGLAFPFVDPSGGGGVRGVGGTRNCDWWFTNEGILLDTAGRYTSETDDRDEWLAFLEMLRKYRPRKPINGVLVAVSITDLRSATEGEILAQAKRLRARIDEMLTHLRMVVPIYVLFTKMDLVAGFTEFWGDLRKSERAQIWGVTFPFPPERAATALVGAAPWRVTSDAFATELDALAQTIHARAVRRVGEERSADARRAILHFPLEFRALESNLAEFVGAMSQPNAFQETPIVRGVYFTSGTQEGSPVDLVIGGMLRAFNIAGAPPIEAPPAQKEHKGYFVTDMFRRVIFPDRSYAGRTLWERRRRLVNRIAFAAAASLLAGLLVVPASCAFLRNRALLEATEVIATQAEAIPWGDPRRNVTDKAKGLDDIFAQLKQLDGWRHGAPAEYRWGMYVGDDLYAPLRAEYVHSLQIGFAVPAKLHLESELRALPDVSLAGATRYGELFDHLKAYLESCDRERLDVAWEATALTEAWARALGATTGDDATTLQPHVDYYLELLKRGEISPWTCDDALIKRARASLKRAATASGDYAALLVEANRLPPVTRESIFLTTAFGAYVRSKSTPPVAVPGAFTKEGWELYVRRQLGKERAAQLADERWVFGEPERVGAAQVRKTLDELRQQYFADYTKTWADFLRDLDVRKPADDKQALEELSALSAVPWPYLVLIRALDENVHLAESPVDRIEREIVRKNPLAPLLADAGVAIAPSARWISPPEAAFAPLTSFALPPGPTDPNAPPRTQLGHYQDQIVAGVIGKLTEARDLKGRGPGPRELRAKREEATRATTELIARSQTAFTSPLLAPLLLAPLRGSP
jgi:type VI secretion system protein ImpL